MLQTIARLAPQVLADLAAVSHPDDHAAIRAWAVQYGVDAQWMLCAARNTLALWELWPKVRGARWEMNFDDEGALVPERGRVPSGPRELLIRSEHFDWLVRSRILGEEKITDPPQTARTAVHKLEHVLGLSTK